MGPYVGFTELESLEGCGVVKSRNMSFNKIFKRFRCTLKFERNWANQARTIAIAIWGHLFTSSLYPFLYPSDLSLVK